MKTKQQIIAIYSHDYRNMDLDQPELEKMLNDFLEEIEDVEEDKPEEEMLICRKCGHLADSHYWNGGGRVEASGYDSCRVDGCGCCDYDEKTDFILSPPTQTTKHLDKIQSTKEKAVVMDCDKHLDKLVIPTKIDKKWFSSHTSLSTENLLYKKQCEIIDYLISLQKEK
jgi:hypothetical protein